MRCMGRGLVQVCYVQWNVRGYGHRKARWDKVSRSVPDLLLAMIEPWKGLEVQEGPGEGTNKQKESCKY